MKNVTLKELRSVPAGESDAHQAIVNTLAAHAGLPDSHSIHVPQAIVDLVLGPQALDAKTSDAGSPVDDREDWAKAIATIGKTSPE